MFSSPSVGHRHVGQQSAESPPAVTKSTGTITLVCLPCDSLRTRVRFSATSVPFSNNS